MVLLKNLASRGVLLLLIVIPAFAGMTANALD